MVQHFKQKRHKMIAKVSLAVYCFLIIAFLISFLLVSFFNKDWSYMYGFLLCLLPGIIFILCSLLIPSPGIVSAKVGKGGIIFFIVLNVIKYALIVGIPFIGLPFPHVFNKWAMLTITLVAPIQVFITKLIIANIVGKNSEK